MSSVSPLNPRDVLPESGSLNLVRLHNRGGRVDLPELWRYRELLWFLALRDIQVRYKQSALGAAWAIIQPVVMMVVFSFVFGRMMNVAARVDVPYPVFAYAGLLPSTFFAASVNGSASSLVGNAHLLGKVYFPRLLMPLAAIGAPLLDFALAFVVLIGLMIWYGVAPSVQLLWLPVMIGSVIICAMGVGLWLSALIVSYRDFRHVVPYMLQVWLFLTPVIYPIQLPEQWAWLIHLNPMAGTISAMRAAVLGTPIDFAAWGVSLGIGLLLLTIGLREFVRRERRFADVI